MSIDCTFSIIVPVYNVADYIEKCLNSLLTQLNISYEIILIDDGSTDGSSEICDLWSALYSIVTVIHQPNQGLSAARNKGIDCSKGEYLLFVDSDDLIENNILYKLNLLIKTNKPDIIFLNGNKLFLDGTTKLIDQKMDRRKIVNQPQYKVLSYLSTMDKFPGSACTKLIKRSFIIENNLYFILNKTYEDLYWTYNLLLSAQKFDYFDEDYYYYRQNREGSITSTFDRVRFKDSYNIIPYVILLLKNKSSSNLIRIPIYKLLSYHYGILLMQYKKLPDKAKKEYSKKLKKYKYLLNYKKDLKTIIASISINILGLNGASLFANLYYRTKNGFWWRYSK